MRYLNQICFIYTLVINVFNYIALMYFRYTVNERGTVK